MHLSFSSPPSRRVPRRRRSALLAATIAAGAMLALPTAAPAQAPSITTHAVFQGGQTSGYTVGTVIQVQYNDPSGQTREEQVCWSPAPIDLPACTPTGTGAPASTGTQQITVELTNGKSVSTSFQVGAAPTTLGNGTSNSPPVPYTITCSTELYANAGGNDPLQVLTPGDEVAAYYRANSTTLQVYNYASNQAGFVASNCTDAPPQQARTYQRTVRLRSNRSQTYRLSLPQGFEPQGPGTPIAYQLYVGNRKGDGVGNYIRQRGGVHKPFLGAIVTSDGYNSRFVFVRVRTARLQDPITLLITAYGTT
jgi:hypothetical protein